MTQFFERLRVAFFRSFFRLLVLFVALSEWVCIAWAVARAGFDVPPIAHVVAPLAIYGLNHALALRRPRPGAQAARPPGDGSAPPPRDNRQIVPLLAFLTRVYIAVAFTCIFGGLFLLLAGGVGLIAGVVVRPVLAALGVSTATLATIGHVYARFTDLCVVVITGLLAYGYLRGNRALVVSRLTVLVPRLAPALDGLRIVQISDLHIGAYCDTRELAAHVERVNQLAPDLICVTGDIVDRAETGPVGFPVLAGLRARYGVIVILGNHDFYAGADQVTRDLRRHTTFTVLRNETTTVAVDGERLHVVGVDDLGLDWARGVPEHPALPPLVAALPDNEPFIVLSHRPDCFPQAADLGAALTLSGHTHGGQLALPHRRGRKPRNLAEFITSFDRGDFHRGDAMLYVNRGIGFTGQKIRLFSPREIAVLELRAS